MTHKQTQYFTTAWEFWYFSSWLQIHGWTWKRLTTGTSVQETLLHPFVLSNYLSLITAAWIKSGAAIQPVLSSPARCTHVGLHCRVRGRGGKPSSTFPGGNGFPTFSLQSM